VDAILIIGILILLVALLGVGGVINALGSIAWVLLIVALIVIAWRVIAGRRPV
jgi:predicted lipid-binding transport protein (Tim44 family)